MPWYRLFATLLRAKVAEASRADVRVRYCKKCGFETLQLPREMVNDWSVPWPTYHLRCNGTVSTEPTQFRCLTCGTLWRKKCMSESEKWEKVELEKEDRMTDWGKLHNKRIAYRYGTDSSLKVWHGRVSGSVIIRIDGHIDNADDRVVIVEEILPDKLVLPPQKEEWEDVTREIGLYHGDKWIGYFAKDPIDGRLIPRPAETIALGDSYRLSDDGRRIEHKEER